ncbi:hypothetical protein MSG28_016103 [Choristoneura fumiferana]|uniref:Uncharacterized protein n=1 Tax=Choristoneura fumiferana TaxID=7141 RepID=A0ACC0K5G7_CHOFU|nr:hypothetical protein MSG28_016103 [Choristoneura fumiferana]
MEQVLYNVAQTVEKQLDNELERCVSLTWDPCPKRPSRPALWWLNLGLLKVRIIEQDLCIIVYFRFMHCDCEGPRTIDGEKEFFAVCGKSDRVVCHFYRGDAPRCRIFDMHLKLLATKHVETRFVKMDAERAPFLTGRLKIRVIPTLALVTQNKTRDFVVGFTELGNRDDFSTETLEWRLAR